MKYFAVLCLMAVFVAVALGKSIDKEDTSKPIDTDIATTQSPAEDGEKSKSRNARSLDVHEILKHGGQVQIEGSNNRMNGPAPVVPAGQIQKGGSNNVMNAHPAQDGGNPAPRHARSPFQLQHGGAFNQMHGSGGAQAQIGGIGNFMTGK